MVLCNVTHLAWREARKLRDRQGGRNYAVLGQAGALVGVGLAAFCTVGKFAPELSGPLRGRGEGSDELAGGRLACLLESRCVLLRGLLRISAATFTALRKARREPP